MIVDWTISIGAILQVASIIIGALLLSGCASSRPATINGECRVFRDPGFAVRGARLQDKQWIGRTQQTGIDVCGWQRPAK